MTIAETDLGRIGMLICWDVPHLDMWQSYAGNLDLMLISSCPIDFGHAQFSYPNSDFFMPDDLGSRFAAMSDSATLAFSDMMNQQTVWLGVPVVHASGCGYVHTGLPMARCVRITLTIAAPWLLKYFPQQRDFGQVN